MKILDVTWSHYRIPLRNGFSTAHGMLNVREGAIVEVLTAGGITGIGEVAPMPEFGGGNLRHALASLPVLRTLLQGMHLSEALTLLYNARDVPNSAACGVEIALLDAQAQAEQHSLASLLATNHSHASGPARSRVPVNAVIGAASTETDCRHAQEAIEAGSGCIKLKVANNTNSGDGVRNDIERITALRNTIGAAIHLRLDANEGWTFAQACTILQACQQSDLQYVEQPLKATDLAGMHTLRNIVTTPIAADEAVYNLASARRILAAEAADILIIKPQLAGGLHVSQQIIHEAAEQHVQCVITSTIEAGIGLVAALHLAAASPEITMECGLATLSLLEDDLLLDNLIIDNGFLAVPTSPGLGVHLDREALARYAVRDDDPELYI